MTIASAGNKRVGLKKESAWGTLAGATGAQLLRRLSSDLSLDKDTYESAEKVDHQQVQDMRHGVKRVTGTLNGELSPGTYKLPMQSILRKDFVTGVNSTALTNVTAAAGPPGTFTRAAGSFLTDGFKVGDIIRWTGWTTTGTNNNTRNYRITVLTATVMTVVGTGNEVVAAKASGDSVTATVVGKKSHIPIASHTSDSYTIEHWFADIAQSEQFVGCRFGGMDLSLPATWLATIAMRVLGRDMVSGTAAYFTTPTAAPETGIAAAVNGLLRVGTSDLVVVTGADISVDLGLVASDPVVGSNLLPGIFFGPRARVTGTLTAFFEDAVLRDAFINETVSSLAIQLALGSAIDAGFLNIVIPKLKFGGARKDDPDTAIKQTLPFVGLLDTDGGAGEDTEETTISVQDSTI